MNVFMVWYLIKHGDILIASRPALELI